MLKLRVDVFIVEQDCAYHEVDGHDYKAIHVFCLDEGGIAAYARLLPSNVKYPDPSVGRVIVRQDKRGQGLHMSSWKSALITLQTNGVQKKSVCKHSPILQDFTGNMDLKPFPSLMTMEEFHI